MDSARPGWKTRTRFGNSLRRDQAAESIVMVEEYQMRNGRRNAMAISNKSVANSMSQIPGENGRNKPTNPTVKTIKDSRNVDKESVTEAAFASPRQILAPGDTRPTSWDITSVGDRGVFETVRPN